MKFLLLLFLVSPLAAVAGILLGLPAKRLAVLSGLVNLAAALALFFVIDPAHTEYQLVFSMPCIRLQDFFAIDFKIGADGLTLCMLLLTSLVGLAALAVSPEKIRRGREFYICLLLIIFGAVGAFLSIDLFFLYIFHEVALIPTFLLIGIWGGQDRKFAATQLTIYLAAGSLVLLAGLLAFYFALPVGARSFDLEAIRSTLLANPLGAAQQKFIYPLLLAGFGILISLWPFHSWAPQGYAAAPAPVAMLHAGVLKKFGFYGLIRLVVPFLPLALHMRGYAALLGLLLLGNVILTGLVTLNQRDLNLMLGYSSVMHMGFLFLGFLSMSVIGLTGVVVLMVAHGLSAALLFGLSGEIRERAGSTTLTDLGGLGHKTPVLTFLFILGGLASLGMPGLGNFAGEIMIFFGAWHSYPWLTALVLWGIVISAVYMLRAIRNIFFGEPGRASVEVTDLYRWSQRWPYVMLALALLVLGVCPSLLITHIKPFIISLRGL